MDTPADMLTTGQAARLIGVNATTLIRYADRGQITCHTLPSGHRRFLRRDLEVFLDTARKATA